MSVITDNNGLPIANPTKLKCYYSHSVEIYGKEQEDLEMNILKTKLPSYYKIINPKWYQADFVKSGKKFNYWLQIIDDCQALAYSLQNGVITKGVEAELKYANELMIDIYMIKGIDLVKVKRGDVVTSRENIVGK